MASEQLPIIGISMGDPAGIGPEICAKTLALKEIYDMCRPIVVGDAGAMRAACNGAVRAAWMERRRRSKSAWS